MSCAPLLGRVGRDCLQRRGVLFAPLDRVYHSRESSSGLAGLRSDWMGSPCAVRQGALGHSRSPRASPHTDGGSAYASSQPLPPGGARDVPVEACAPATPAHARATSGAGDHVTPLSRAAVAAESAERCACSPSAIPAPLQRVVLAGSWEACGYDFGATHSVDAAVGIRGEASVYGGGESEARAARAAA